MPSKTAIPQSLRSHLSDSEVEKVGKYHLRILANEISLHKNKKTVLIISGPSGSGKDSFINQLPDNFVRVKTVTTRTPRPEEIKNDPYIRLTKEEFFEAVKEGEILEYIEHAGYYMGTKISAFDEIFSHNKIPVLRVDTTGAKLYLELSKTHPKLKRINFIYLCLVAPSKSELKKRIIKREGQTGKLNLPDHVIKKLEILDHEISYAKYAHYIVVNKAGKLKEVVNETLEIIKKHFV
ncbi:MAG: hypothetical protein N2558_04280 [Patescibacteria group bacterium]|nr:hypothetical protein [Patescibacteria group bacterium]